MNHNIGQQLTIHQLTAHLSTSHVAIGVAGEILAARCLECSGYRVDIAHEKGDLTVISTIGVISYVEVKTARKGRDGRFSFTLYKKVAGKVRTDHKHADYLILLCVSKSGNAIPFVIPIETIKDRSAFAICGRADKYSGQYAQYRQTIKCLRLPL